MSYVRIRLYSGARDRTTEELARITMDKLMPILQQVPGLQAYSAAEFSGERIGSLSAFESKDAAEKSMPIAANFMKETEGLQLFTLSQNISGEVIFQHHGKEEIQLPAYAMLRVYQTSASVADMQEAMKQEAVPLANTVDGFLDYGVIKLDEGNGYVSFTLCRSTEASEDFAEKARQIRGKDGSLLSKVLPQDPEVIEARLLAGFRPN
jgi:hypothetical protein